MVLDTLSHLLAPRLSVRNVIQTVGPLAACAAVQSWTRGYKCEESRNVHNKTFIMIGALSGPGLALMRDLASRGAQIIALHPDPSSPDIVQLLLLLRSSTGNERIYAEECDILDIASARSFAKRWETEGRSGMVQDLEARIDGIVFCDGAGAGLESTGRGMAQQLVPTGDIDEGGPLDLYHASYTLARHALVQFLLPALLRSASTSSTPIRIVHQVSPFYSAVPELNIDDLDYATRAFPKWSPWLAEGQASLASIVLVRESQQRLADKANIIFLSVCCGFTRHWFYHSVLRSTFDHPSFSWIGYILSWILWPLVWCLMKSANAASQILQAAVLGQTVGRHLPSVDAENVTKETSVASSVDPSTSHQPMLRSEEAKSKLRLRGGVLYREGLEVRIPSLERAPPELGSQLWDLESRRVQRLVKLAEEKDRAEKASNARDK